TACEIGWKSLIGSYGTLPIAGLITSEPIVARWIVWPSGVACAARCDPIVPFAPVRLSTTTCWPSSSEYLGAMMRATRSVAPPGGKPMMRRTGLVGKFCAAAGHAAASNPIEHATRAALRYLCNLICHASVEKLPAKNPRGGRRAEE